LGVDELAMTVEGGALELTTDEITLDGTVTFISRTEKAHTNPARGRRHNC
jgi:hypothetical protein